MTFDQKLAGFRYRYPHHNALEHVAISGGELAHKTTPGRISHADARGLVANGLARILRGAWLIVDLTEDGENYLAESRAAFAEICE